MAAKPKAKTKKMMTLDDFAVAIQRDLAHMATKDDIRELRENMATKLDIKQIHGRLRDLSDDVKTVTDAMVSKADLTEALRTELGKPEYVNQIDKLHERVLRIEEKLGMKHGQRAA